MSAYTGRNLNFRTCACPPWPLSHKSECGLLPSSASLPLSGTGLSQSAAFTSQKKVPTCLNLSAPGGCICYIIWLMTRVRIWLYIAVSFLTIHVSYNSDLQTSESDQYQLKRLLLVQEDFTFNI